MELLGHKINIGFRNFFNNKSLGKQFKKDILARIMLILHSILIWN